MRRTLSAWLPRWPTDRWQRNNGAAAGPFALIRNDGRRLSLAAVDAAAAALGLSPGMALADARALSPGLLTAAADEEGDRAALGQLADWCGRYSPWVACDGADGLLLDLTGVAHLFGGEMALLEELTRSFTRLKLEARFAIAGPPAAARAWARFGPGGLLPNENAVNALPIAALDLDGATLQALAALGLRCIADLQRQARAPLARRFGAGLLWRLDALSGAVPEPITPRRPPAPWRSRADLAEPLLTREAIDAVLRRLLDALCGLLHQDQRGVRRLALHAYRVDGACQSLRIGTAAASRDAAHLFRLFRETLDRIEPGFGIETLLLEAEATDPLGPAQKGLNAGSQQAEDFPRLVDRLQARLGARAVYRPAALESHCPERAVTRLSPLARQGQPLPAAGDPRPVLLLAPPEPAEMATDGAAFRWRRVLRLIRSRTGPERLRSEWWRDGMDVAARDYYRIEDNAGRRYWLYRAGDGAWFVQGLFP